ncbi:MAG: peptidoglycan-associated lipoprotein Pal [Desulfuromonadaceae bacterium]|nr:peptidoglycan-associated lipoprotein Pal [Desulfuromonadaceae bacterium]
MKKSMVTLLAALSMVSLLAAGCANKEAVKKEEAVVPPAAVEKVEPAKPAEEAKPAEKAAEAQPVQEAVTPAATPQAEQPAAAENNFETVYFDFDKSDLRQDARDVLSKNAELILKSFPNAKIQIAGNCDERGSAEYNLALGERRAKSAQKYLITLGVKAENLSTISYGKEKPAVLGHDEAAWAKNRRDDFVVIK